MFGLKDETILAKYVIKTHYIMRVIAFHPEDQTVDLIQETFEFCNTPVGEITVVNELGYEVNVGLLNPTVLKRIPVKQERWGQFEIQCCPQPGDTGYIEIFTNDISSWIKNGKLSIPSSDRHFVKDSSVFVPFIPNSVNKASDYPTDGKTLIIKSRGAKIVITDDGEKSDVSILADTMTVTAQDGVSITGDVTVEGTIHATTDVTAGNTNTSLTSHMHNYVEPKVPAEVQPGTTTVPISTGA